MTNEKAVNYLRLNKPTSGYPGLCEAIDIAIAALAAPVATAAGVTREQLRSADLPAPPADPQAMPTKEQP
ncbi:MAG: hypothetical protein IT181_13055 [Acidobacteria bacterium]|nr:hypothetical protein [Acidobacteriota bacterium]